MSAFIGLDNVGIWVTNGERDSFLDWFADCRCSAGDELWTFCKSEEQRWPGCSLDLTVILRGQSSLEITDQEIVKANQIYYPGIGELLLHMERIAQGTWDFVDDSYEAAHWRKTPLESP